ncbi:17 beta hydroxysteroid dehydrogenase type 6 [Trichuris trichiura]|uniref:17 beta hydroxysteroid dehydrogenase type 6 n=1 Tax=Trichuris trichiura TaxID=36087 RepID=A0A077Z114_TRITR|nr:17 beta hydroxysteroid dehydrogenase type 6 [Trichuris trichiura]
MIAAPNEMTVSLVIGFISFAFVVPLFCKMLEMFLRRRSTIGNLTKKAVFITGCDSGFGRLLALRTVALGMPTFAACKTEKGVQSLKQLLSDISPKSSEKAWVLQLDITSQSDVEEAYAFVRKNLGSSELWALVNNAGILGVSLPDEWLTIDDYRQAMEVNFFGQIRVAQTFRPMLENSHGRMIFMSSVLGRVSAPLLGPYQTTKHALDSYVDMLRQELLCRNVFVSVMEPGFFTTDLTHRGDPLQLCIDQGRLSEKEAEEFAGKQLLLILFLLWNCKLLAYGSHKRFLEVLCSQKTEMVTRAYEEAITSKYPRYRYSVGLDAFLLWLPLAYAPTWFSLWLSAIVGKILDVNKILEKRRVHSS